LYALNLLNWFDKILQFFVYPKYKAAVNIRKTKIAQNFFYLYKCINFVQLLIIPHLNKCLKVENIRYS